MSQNKNKQLFKQFQKDPASNINSLNQIIPEIIQSFKNDQIDQSIEQITTLIENLIEHDLLNKNQIFDMIIQKQNKEIPNQIQDFILTRLNVLLTSIIEMSNQSKIISKILDLFQHLLQLSFSPESQSSIQTLLQSENSLIQQLCTSIMNGKAKCKDLFMTQYLRQYLEIYLFTLKSDNIKFLKEIFEDIPLINSNSEIKTFFFDIPEIQTNQDEDDEELEEPKTELEQDLVKLTQTQFQKAYLKYLAEIKDQKTLKKVITEMPKIMVPNFQNPLILSDFLTSQLNSNEDIQIQVLSLRAIFILLERHGLDYPNYYTKVYDMLKPRLQFKGSSVTQTSIFNMPEKSRFLRLLDLSLRSSKLPLKLIASFMKRLARIVVQYGEGSREDIIFVISLIANLIKRHPKCLSLIHRKGNESQMLTFHSDPYNEEEKDPLQTKAIKSCLWELDLIIKSHWDEKVRNYCKVMKTDFMRKESFFKCEEFSNINGLDMIQQELEEIDEAKEGLAMKKNLLRKYGQASVEDKLGKRSSDQVDYSNQELLEIQNSYDVKRAKYGEEFQDLNEILALSH